MWQGTVQGYSQSHSSVVKKRQRCCQQEVPHGRWLPSATCPVFAGAALCTKKQQLLPITKTWTNSRIVLHSARQARCTGVNVYKKQLKGTVAVNKLAVQRYRSSSIAPPTQQDAAVYSSACTAAVQRPGCSPHHHAHTTHLCTKSGALMGITPQPHMPLLTTVQECFHVAAAQLTSNSGE